MLGTERPATRPLPAVTGCAVHRMALADAAEWAEFAVLPAVQQYTSTSVTGPADLVPMIQRSLSDDEGAPVLFTLRHVPSGELMGTFGFHTISAINRTAEITYTVRPEHWGRGLATLVCNAAVGWGFQHRGWVRIQATVLEPNLASRRVLQKCGFVQEGLLRNFRMVRGQPRDYLLFASVSGPALAGPSPAGAGASRRDVTT